MQKNVVVFIPEFPVLSETFIEREIDKLIESRKIDVFIVTTKSGTGFRSKKAERATNYEKLTLPVMFLSLSYLFKRSAKVIEALSVLGISHIYEFIKSIGYAKIFAKYEPQVIYSHFLSKPSTIALGAAIILDLPIVISAHAKDVFENADLVKQKAKYSEAILFCNKRAMEKVAELSGLEDTNNLKLVYHGCNPSNLVVTRDGRLKKPSKIFIFSIARLVEKKGINYLIKAAKILEDSGTKHKIFVAGGGPLYEELDKQIEDLKLWDNFVLLGPTKFDNIKAYLDLADLFVLPSIKDSNGDSDGVPNTLIEAALAKVPIVTTDAGSIGDFLDETNATIVPQKDSQALASGMEKVLGNNKLRDSLTEKAYQKALDMFDEDKNVGELEEILFNA